MNETGNCVYVHKSLPAVDFYSGYAQAAFLVLFESRVSARACVYVCMCLVVYSDLLCTERFSRIVSKAAGRAVKRAKINGSDLFVSSASRQR